jgi:nucleoid-associated protein YgaU
VKKIILATSFAMLVPLVAGCDKNKKAETQPTASITDVAPPAPTHSGAGSASTWSPSSSSSSSISTPVTPINYDEAPSDSQFSSNTSSTGSFGAAPAATTGGGRTYKVQRGDTLWSIAKRTYGDGTQYKRIVAANPSVRNDRLMVGQTLTLP